MKPAVKRYAERGLRWLLIGVMTVAGIVWVLHAPYDPDAVWRAIPAEAVFFSRHRQAAARLPELSRNPLIETLLRSAGIRPSALEALREDSGTERWVRDLFGQDVVLAYVPDLGGSREPAWVFASWVGNRAQRLRWTISIRGMRGIQPVELPGRETFWKLEGQSVEAGQYVSLALVDGYLLGCISRFPAGVKIPVATWNREQGYPSLQTDPWRKDMEAKVSPEPPDWAAFKGFHPDRRAETSMTLAVALRRLDASYAKGQLVAGVATPGMDGAGMPALDGLRDILGEAPTLMMFVSPSWFKQLPASHTPWWVTASTRELAAIDAAVGMPAAASNPAGRPLFISVLAPRYAGSYRPPDGYGWAGGAGLSVPSVIAGLHVGDAERADAVLMEILDRLNREFRLGLIPRRDPMERVTVIEDSRSGLSLYQRLALRERVGVAYRDGWLLFAGQAMGLEQLLESANRRREPYPAYAWLPPAGAEAAPLYGWTDLTVFAPMADDALSATMWMLWATAPRRSHALRDRLAAVRGWIERVRAMRQCRIWIDRTEPDLRIQFVLGIAAGDTLE